MFRVVDVRHKLEGAAVSALGGIGATLGAQGFRGWPDLVLWALFWGAASYAWQPGASGALDEQKVGFFRCRLRRVAWLLAAVAIPLWLCCGQERYVGWVVGVCGSLGIVLGSLPCLRVGGRVRIELGWASGSPPVGLYLALALWVVALAAATLSKEHSWLASASVFGAGALMVALKSRGYVEVSKETILVAPHGGLGPKLAWPTEALLAVEARGDGTLVFLVKDGAERVFGPWKSYWASSTGMRSRCESAAQAIRARLP